MVLQWRYETGTPGAEATPQGLAHAAQVQTAWNEPAVLAGGRMSHLVDTTMLFAPRSGGVKRYLLAKRAWMAENRPQVRHTLVVPGDATRNNGKGTQTVAAVRLPFGDGYRWPTSAKRWADLLIGLKPDLIEAGDPYGPGHAALEAGERLGVPVVGFCHSDPAALAALHLGSWAEPPVRRRWARLFRRFDRVVAPSRHIADRLDAAGVSNVHVQPLGVDTQLFCPSRRDPERLRTELGIGQDTRLLVFAGRPAREKNVDVLLEAMDLLGDEYHLLLIHAGQGCRQQDNATFLDYVREPREMARLLSSCDAFVHANDREPFGLIALEAMACGLPMVGVASGGIAELVDEEVGQLAHRATAEAMAEAISALFERDTAALGSVARARAEQHYGWHATFTGLSALYGQLCGTPGLAAGAVTNPLPFPRERP